MLELGTKELITLGTVLAGLAATYGVIKSTIKTITEQLAEEKDELASLNTRLDKVEAVQAVATSSIDTMAKDILSPQILKERSERDGRIEQRLDSIERELDNFHKMHNGSHPNMYDTRNTTNNL